MKKERYSGQKNSTIIQRAAAAALTGPQTCVAEMRQTYHQRRDLAVSLLKDLGRYVYWSWYAQTVKRMCSINHTRVDFIGQSWYTSAMDKQLKSATLRLAASLRSLREEKGLTIGALARQTGLSKSTISTIEAGTANPSLEVLWRLTRALGVPLGALLGAEQRPELRVIRAGEGTVVASESGARLRLLLAEARYHRTEVYELSLGKEEGYVSAAHAVGTEEFLLCLEGSLEVGPLGQEVSLMPGDALWFVADQPHGYRTPEGARAVAMMLYPAVM